MLCREEQGFSSVLPLLLQERDTSAVLLELTCSFTSSRPWRTWKLRTISWRPGPPSLARPCPRHSPQACHRYWARHPRGPWTCPSPSPSVSALMSAAIQVRVKTRPRSQYSIRWGVVFVTLIASSFSAEITPLDMLSLSTQRDDISVRVVVRMDQTPSKEVGQTAHITFM